MFPLWDAVVAPLVGAADAKRVLEIGALRGETTAKMFEQLGPDCELHVIDPLPQFDPAEHAREFGGRYVFHRDLSLNVLPTMPAVDVALIDGDHNWYTVSNELRLLHEAAGREKRLLPVLVLHDVHWPYGHRDLYYEPSQIPEGQRQPFARKGIVPGFYRVVEEGGLNADLANAIDAGGSRNGVRCALDDFLEAYSRPYRLVDLPLYFGLAIVVDQERLDASPDLRDLLNELESVAGKDKLLRLGERIRLDEAVLNQNVQADLRRRGDGLRRRYLDLLAAALLDEHYLENEVRLEFLLAQPPGRPVDPAPLRDPVRTLPVRWDRLAKGRAAGRSTDGEDNLAYFPYTDVGHAVLAHLEHLVDAGPDTGDLVEVGVGRGGTGIYLKALLASGSAADRDLWVVDRFVAGDAAEADADTSPMARFRADLNQVRDGYHRFGVLDDRVRFLVGPYAEVLDDVPIGPTALLRVGEAVGSDLEHVFEVLLPRVMPGGSVVVSGIGQPRLEKALADVRDRLGSREPVQRVDWNTASWTVAAQPTPERARPRRLGRRPPRRVTPVPAPVANSDPLDLTVVVVFYDMRREAARTLRSLSRSYQVGLETTSYEVLVVDNGSSPDQRLSAEEVASYGPEFRLIEMGDDATSSPTRALNRGIAASRGRAVAMMIDGAHVLTPGVLGLGLKAMATYEPAIVAVQQWYVGPGQQGDAQQAGYDQAAEDRLFANIRWPVDGYRLFEIGHFIGDRDWFDGIVESNCLFAPRQLLEQVGAFDDSFAMPGGGYANLELFERLGAHPGINAASILGEGSFHQFHGGTTTNVLDEAIRRERIFSYGEHFTELRGRGLLGLNTPVNFVGSMATKAARRTRSRREITLAFDPARDTVTTTSAEPTHVPDELKLAATEAIWDRQAWRDATWLGHPVNRYPTDLHSYQELLVTAAPDVVVMVADDPGLIGRALFAAGVCDQLGRGRVIAVGATEGLPAHPRLTGVAGDVTAVDVVAGVNRLAAGDPALVFIGLGAVERVLSAFDAYTPLVPVGGYVVIEHTVVNGRPAASGFGPGPHEAVVSILGRRREFVADAAYERYTITFNKGGFLRRTAPS